MVFEKEGFLKVDYSRLTAVLIEAVKELNARVKALEAKAWEYKLYLDHI